jgi:hypothetical protein
MKASVSDIDSMNTTLYTTTNQSQTQKEANKGMNSKKEVKS